MSYAVGCSIAGRKRRVCRPSRRGANMLKPLQLMLGRVVRTGDLTFIDSRGGRHHFGDATGPPIAVKLADKRIEYQLTLDPELAAGEGYMSGRLTMASGSVYDFIALMMRNLEAVPFPAWTQ